MNEQKRMVLMLVAVGVLVVANVYMRMSDATGSAMFFEGLTDLEESWSAKLKKNMNDIEALPELNFRMRKEAFEPEEGDRNPFIFGVDRAKEQAQQDRMQALADARAKMLEQQEQAAAAEPEPVEVKPRFDGKLLGVMENAVSGEVIVSVKYDNEYHVLRPGDILENTYKLVDVTPLRVRLLALASSQEIDIQLEPR